MMYIRLGAKCNKAQLSGDGRASHDNKLRLEIMAMNRVADSVEKTHKSSTDGKIRFCGVSKVRNRSVRHMGLAVLSVFDGINKYSAVVYENSISIDIHRFTLVTELENV